MPAAAHIEIFHIPPGIVHAAWPEIARLIAPAVDMADGRHTLSTTLGRLQAGKMQCLVALRDARPVMACVTQVGLYPAQKWLQIPFCGGREMSLWLEPLVDAIDGLAYDTQCVGVEISGRGGWARVLRPFGYRPSAHHNLLVKTAGMARARKAAE